MTTIADITLFDQITVGEQYRIQLLVGAKHHAIRRHHIRAVGEERDLAKALGLALGEKIAIGDVKTHQRRIGRGANQRLDLQRHLIRRVRNDQLAAFQPVLATAERFAIHAQRDQLQLFAVQHEIGLRTVRVAAMHAARCDARFGRIQIKTYINLLYPIGGRSVIMAMNGGGGICAHGKVGGILRVKTSSHFTKSGCMSMTDCRLQPRCAAIWPALG